MPEIDSETLAQLVTIPLEEITTAIEETIEAQKHQEVASAIALAITPLVSAIDRLTEAVESVGERFPSSP